MKRMSVVVPRVVLEEARALLKERLEQRKERGLPGRIGIASSVMELAFIGAEQRISKRKGGK